MYGHAFAAGFPFLEARSWGFFCILQTGRFPNESRHGDTFY